MKDFIKRKDTILLTLGSLILGVGTMLGWLPFSKVEAFAFISGAICVWLVVKESVWNFPIGIINNVLFIYLFVGAQLYADAGLQVWYILVSLFGIVVWMYGRRIKVIEEVDLSKQVVTPGIGYSVSGTIKKSRNKRAPKPITKVSLREALIVLALAGAATYWMYERLSGIEGTSPVWDSLTTGLSLAAFWGQCRKLLESWYLWIAADLIYIPLYFSRDLPLTGILYGIFLAMCIAGLAEWKRRMRGTPLAPPTATSDLTTKTSVDGQVKPA